ncbi:TPA: hypothetical protein NKV88_004082 [Vibrio parahaemolyticus]|uniref:cold-shock protein n=1 Tax=Vibrio parahaemolyticus TaxID=670 RepID=UPI000414882B|nr:hypothetical protein [Vibrio parahaemolyticus]MBE4066609.1 hypothetical protein [Vibrio parahaemolyticus]MBE4800727.1 hypothetical protein [Vibrio parahaemolyticus]HCH4150724.1 hypothetical protein [Vibrio parahaemolyticus]
MQQLKFGKIKNYKDDRGFGFIFSECKFTHDAIMGSKEVFFHIKQAKQFESVLRTTTPKEDLCFWFTTETTRKGEAAKQMWSKLSEVPQDIREDNAKFINQITENIKTYETARAEKRAREAVQQEALRKARETRDSELNALIVAARSQGFSTSGELSAWIRTNKLWTKYPTLTGDLTMHDGKDSWNFGAAIDPRYYKQVCQALGLHNAGSNARAGAFRSYASMKS